MAERNCSRAGRAESRVQTLQQQRLLAKLGPGTRLAGNSDPGLRNKNCVALPKGVHTARRRRSRARWRNGDTTGPVLHESLQMQRCLILRA